MNFRNQAFKEIFDGVSDWMPMITFFGIIATYLITAGLNVFFLPLPLFVSVPAALAIAFTRFSIVFMDFLNPTGRRSVWPGLIACGLTMLAIVELGFSIQDLGWKEAKFWASFLFGTTIILGGYLQEINFVAKGAEAYGLQSRSSRPATVPAPTPPVGNGQAPKSSGPTAAAAKPVPANILTSSNGHSNGNGKVNP